jgi:hypothetical protein
MSGGGAREAARDAALLRGCGVLGGCETDMVWVRPGGVTEEDGRRDGDERSCEAQMRPDRPLRPGDDARFERMLEAEVRRDMRNACLEARGDRQRLKKKSPMPAWARWRSRSAPGDPLGGQLGRQPAPHGPLSGANRRAGTCSQCPPARAHQRDGGHTRPTGSSDGRGVVVAGRGGRGVLT